MEGIVITQNTPSSAKAPKSNQRKITELLSIQLRSYSYLWEFNNNLQQEFGARHHGIKDDPSRSSYILLARPSTLIQLSYSIYTCYQNTNLPTWSLATQTV